MPLLVPSAVAPAPVTSANPIIPKDVKVELLTAIFSIVVALTLGAMSPGPSFVMVARTSLAVSRRDGLAAAVGMGGARKFRGHDTKFQQSQIANKPRLFMFINSPIG